MNCVVFCLFFVSGACGLIYQVVWTRMMTHVFGTTVLAVSTVLAAFMAGLALGSYYLGKRGDKSGNPLKRYAVYEVGIGLAALVALFFMDRLAPLSVWMTHAFGYSFPLFSLARFIFVFLLILVPTTLMGATLPILSRFVITHYENIGRLLGSLYATNTLGAVCGGLLAGFFLIGNIGIHNSIYLAVILNIGVGVVSWFLAKGRFATIPGSKARGSKKQRKMDSPKRTEPVTPLQTRLQRLLLCGFALSGLTSFAYEVLWARALVFYLGNSIYAFTIMLTSFLVGIAIGGYLVRFFVDRLKDPMRFFGWIQMGIGLSAAAAMPLLNILILGLGLHSQLESVDPHWGTVILLRYVISFIVMMVTTILVGMTFPLVGKILVRNLDRTGAEVGKVYAVNTLGNIAGALLPAFLLVPVLGIHKGILVMAVVNIGVGMVILTYGRTQISRLRHLAPVGISALAVLVLFLPLSTQYPSDNEEPGDEILYYREGIAATTKVYVKRGTWEKHISVDGIQIGGTNAEVDYKQQWLAHLPKLLLNEYHSELSIGLGSGILVGESARHTSLERIVCVEIAPSVVEGARFFEEDNFGILESPRVEVVVNDGVNYLLTSKDKYDIISTDGKTLPEYGVNGVFFSLEYYTLMRDHLAPGGLVIQWIPTQYPPNVFRTVLRTFTNVFPNTLLWYAEGNCFLVGSNHEIAFDLDSIRRKLNDSESPFEGLRKYGITSAEALFSHLVAAEDVLSEQTAGVSVNSIEKPIVEYYDFRDYAVPEVERKIMNLEFILAVRGSGFTGEIIKTLPAAVANAYEAEGAYIRGRKLLLSGQTRVLTDSHFERAMAMDPDNQDIRYHIFGHILQSGRNLMRAQKYIEAEPYLRRSVQLWPNNTEARYRYGYILMMQDRAFEASIEFEALVALAPDRIPPRHQLSSYYLSNRRPNRAVTHLRAILEVDPEDLTALYNLGNLLADLRSINEAVDILKRAHAIAPTDPGVIDSYAWVTYQSGDKEGARAIVRNGGLYYEGNPAFEDRRRIILKE